MVLERVPERLVAARAFGGIVTEPEVERQRAALAEALGANGAGVDVAAEGEYSVLQYNAPYTVPWRRRNELAVVVIERVAEVVSWYDAGLRL